MSHREDKVAQFIDTMSSGDSNEMASKQKCREVNNNEVDELSKELSEMGCIVDAVKRPNVCVETCVYEGDSAEENDVEDDAYSDEFEEEKSDEEESVITATLNVVEECQVTTNHSESTLKLSQSHPGVGSEKPASISGRSGKSENGSTSTCQTRRVNMSFTNDRLREIERHNHILLTKILSARNTKKSTIPPREVAVRRPVPSAAMQRKNQQRKIDHDNMILLKKIQRAKSSACSIRR